MTEALPAIALAHPENRVRRRQRHHLTVENSRDLVVYCQGGVRIYHPKTTKWPERIE